jgi:hypothetical protein
MTYNYLRSIGLIFLTALGLFSCKLYENKPDQESNNLKSNIIDEAIQANFNTTDSIQIIPNKEDNWILYLTETPTSPAIPNNNISFFVFDKESEKIIYKNKFDNANIKWFDNQQLILTKYLGIIKQSNNINQPTNSGIKTFIINIEKNNIKEITNQTKSKI